MKKYIIITVAVLIAALIASITITGAALKKYKNLYEIELQNVAAYQSANSGLEGQIIEFQMTINDLYASKDTLDQKLVKSLQELDIKEMQLKNLQYQLKKATRTDTIVMTDTIFVPEVSIDTTLSDYWYNLNLKLQYPSTVIATPTFNSEQTVYIYNKKEYVGGKSKCFFINWFKKKYWVTEVKIEESNPYIQTTKQKFIEIRNNNKK